MLKLICSSILLFFLLLSLNIGITRENKATQLNDLNWVEGTWKREGPRGPVFEQWTKVSNQTFEGVSFRISGGDTTFLEFIRLEQFGDEIFYTPKVPHNKYPVPFKLESVDERGFMFENPEHDFPQRIIYKQKKGSFHVRVEGSQNGSESGFDMDFVKVN